MLVGDARGLSLIDGENGNFLYNTGAPRSALQRGCDVAEQPRQSPTCRALRGTAGCSTSPAAGPTVPAKLAAYPFPIAPAANDPPAWPEWRANADRTGVPDPFSLPRTTCAHSVVRGKGYRLISRRGGDLRFRQPPLLRRHERDRYCLRRWSRWRPRRAGAATGSSSGTGRCTRSETRSGTGTSVVAGGTVGPCRREPRSSSIAAPPNGKGYFVVAANGSVYAFGDCCLSRLPRGRAHRRGCRRDRGRPSHRRLLARHLPGAVYAYDAPVPPLGGQSAARRTRRRHRGRAGRIRLLARRSHAAPSTPTARGCTARQFAGASLRRVIGIATDSKGEGYWLAEANGAVLRFGDIASFGQVPARAKMRRITAFSGLS